MTNDTGTKKVRSEEIPSIAVRIGLGWGTALGLFLMALLWWVFGPWAVTAGYITFFKLMVAIGLGFGAYKTTRAFAPRQVPAETPLTVDRQRDWAFMLMKAAEQALQDTNDQIARTGFTPQLEAVKAELEEGLTCAQDEYRRLSGERAADDVHHELVLLRRRYGLSQSDLRTAPELEQPLQQQLGQGDNNG